MPVIETVITTPQDNSNSVQTIDLSKPSAPPPATEAPAQEPAKVEAPAPEPPKQEPPEDPKFASRFAALSRKEKELIQKERSIKEQLAQAEAYKKAVEQARKNPLALLQAAGYKDLEDYLANVINGEPEPDPYKTKVETIEQKIAAYEKQMEEQRVAQAEQRKQQELNAIFTDINNFVESSGEKYEAIKAYNAIPDVWSLIERVYIETQNKVLLTIEQAANEVEQYYLEQAEAERNRIANLKKLQAKKLEAKIETNPTSENTIQVQHKPDVSEWKEPQTSDEWKVPPTLTNTNTSLPQPNSTASLSKEERLRKAAAKLKWSDD